MIGYVKCFDSNKTMSFKISDKKLPKNYTKIWEKISSLIGKEFDSEHVYGDNDKYIETNAKSYGDKINTNFQGKKIPKKNLSCKCLSLIMLDSEKIKSIISKHFWKCVNMKLKKQDSNPQPLSS